MIPCFQHHLLYVLWPLFFDYKCEDFKAFPGLLADNLKQMDTFGIQVCEATLFSPTTLPSSSHHLI